MLKFWSPGKKFENPVLSSLLELLILFKGDADGQHGQDLIQTLCLSYKPQVYCFYIVRLHDLTTL